MTNRRKFLSRLTQATVAASFTGCAGLRLRKNAVIDTHTHFYDPKRPQGVPWPPPDDKLLYRTVLPKHYRALPVPRRVSGTVIVEASPWVEDNKWILDLAANDPWIVGFVGNLPITTDDFAEHLKRFSANKLFSGIRINARKDDLLDGSALLRDLRLLADANLSLDLLGGLEILGFADRISQRLPDLRIVIDHLAGLHIDGKAPPRDWLNQMGAIARRPNIFCKVSGLVEGTGRADGSAPRDAQFYAPVLDVMVNAFGAQRLLYASNWPVSERFAPLAKVQGIIEDYFSARPAGETELVFSGAGRDAYRWQFRI